MTHSYRDQAETLVSAWEKANALAIAPQSRPILLKAVEGTLAAFDPFANEAQSTFWAILHPEKVDSFGLLTAHGNASGLKAYNDILAKLQGQTPPKSNVAQTSLEWHRARGLLPPDLDV